MNTTVTGKPLSAIWIKAAMLGSLWASSEIIIGSFLHNLNVPMTGTLLAAIGVALMVGAHQLWPERGLFWRAAFICAAMKSLSPSAIILGPMIGICTEGLLLEGATRLLGRNLAGYLTGGALAVSSAFLQKLVGLLIAFGWNLVELYNRLFEFAARSLRITQFGALDLVVAFVALNLVAGAGVAGFAVWMGRRARTVGAMTVPLNAPPVAAKSLFAVDARQPFALPLLFVHASFIVFGLLLLNAVAVSVATGVVLTYTTLCAARYQKSLARLSRLDIWIGLALVMMLSGLMLDGLPTADRLWNWHGMLIGYTMTLRAVLMVMGFAAVSVELRNPKVISWFAGRHLETFSSALGAAFVALPEFAALLSQPGKSWRRPLTLFPQLLSHADLLVRAQSVRQHNASPMILLTGEQGEGKSTAAAKLVDALRARGLLVGGILAPGSWKDGKREEFDVLDIRTGRRIPLCRRSTAQSVATTGQFAFLEAGLQHGNEGLAVEALRDVDVIVVDEVGPLELHGDGWAAALDRIVGELDKPMVWVVRRRIVGEVRRRWATGNVRIVGVSDRAVEEIVGALTGAGVS